MVSRSRLSCSRRDFRASAFRRDPIASGSAISPSGGARQARLRAADRPADGVRRAAGNGVRAEAALARLPALEVWACDGARSRRRVCCCSHCRCAFRFSPVRYWPGTILSNTSRASPNSTKISPTAFSAPLGARPDLRKRTAAVPVQSAADLLCGRAVALVGFSLRHRDEPRVRSGGAGLGCRHVPAAESCISASVAAGWPPQRYSMPVLRGRSVCAVGDGGTGGFPCAALALYGFGAYALLSESG